MEEIDLILERVIDLSTGKGFITEADFNDLLDKSNLSLPQIERLIKKIGLLKIVLLEVSPHERAQRSQDQRDYSHTDFSKVFATALTIDPNIKQYIEDVKRIPPPRRGEELQLIKSAKSGNVYAKQRLTKMFLKVVVRNAVWFHEKYGLDLVEAIQEGNIGLVKSIKKFKLGKNDRFSVYFPWWVKQSIQRNPVGLCDHIYVPAYKQEKMFRIKRYLIEKNLDSIDVGVKDKEIMAKEFDLQIGDVEDYLTLIEPPFSLNSEQDVRTLDFDFFRLDNNLEDSVLGYIFYQQKKELVEEFLSEFPARDEQIYRMLYGFDGEEEKTLQQVGDVFGITRERVRQISDKINRMLRVKVVIDFG